MENLLSVSSLLKNINIDETSQSRPLLCAIGFSFEGKYNKNITEDFQNLTQTSSGKALYGDCMHLVDFPKETWGGRVVRRCCVSYITGASN